MNSFSVAAARVLFRARPLEAHAGTRCMRQEGAAANAARLRLDQRQHHLHRNGRVDGRAARLEHLVARVGGQRVGRGHGKLLGGPTLVFGGARRALGLVGARCRPAAVRCCNRPATRRRRSAQCEGGGLGHPVFRHGVGGNPLVLPGGLGADRCYIAEQRLGFVLFLASSALPVSATSYHFVS